MARSQKSLKFSKTVWEIIFAIKCKKTSDICIKTKRFTIKFISFSGVKNCAFCLQINLINGVFRRDHLNCGVWMNPFILEDDNKRNTQTIRYFMPSCHGRIFVNQIECICLQ